MSGSGGQSRRGPRGSKAQVEAVRANAKKAGKELDREQEESVGHLAAALGEISEGEALAHLDTRLAFLERQVERLSARRDEADRGVQGELAVMRARIDDALEAVAGTSQDQKETLASQQKQFSQLILESEHRSSSVSESLRQELVSKVQDSLTRLGKYEARLRGEMKAFEEGATERARAVSETLAQSREELELRVEQAIEEIGGNVTGTSEDILSKLDKTTADLTELIEKTTKDLTDPLERSIEEVSQRLHDEIAETTTNADGRVSDLAGTLESRIAERTAELEELVGRKTRELDERFSRNAQAIEETAAKWDASAADSLESARQEIKEALLELNNNSLTAEHRLSQLEESVTSKVESEKRESEARFSEWIAEVKMENQRLREVIDKSTELVDDRTDAVKRELLMRVHSAEEKATSGAIRLESFFTQLKRELSSGEQEWSERLKGNDELIASLLVRVEELLGRVSSAEAKVSADRGSREAHIQSIAGRVDHMEERIREAVEEVNAKHATKLEMLSSQVSGIAESEVNAEEKLGAVDYLKRRVAEMSEQLDELMVKVNAIGRYMTKPQNAQKLGLPFVPPDVAERFGAIERAVAELASRPSPSSTTPISKEITDRLESLERTVAALTAGLMNVENPKPAEEPVKTRLAQTILPQRRRW